MNDPVRFQAGETGVIVPVAAAQPVVGGWRDRFDTSAPLGVPAHVTLCFPFVPTAVLTAADLEALDGLLAGRRPFPVRFGRAARFPGVLYLEPDPDQPFREMTAALTARWPEYPPYGGAFGDPIPHLTVTETARDDEMAAVERHLERLLPIDTVADHAELLSFDGVRWQPVRQLPFLA